MPRYIRNTVLLAKSETTYGTDSSPTGSANAILVSDVSINPLNANNVSRDLVRGYFGGSDQLVGTYNVEVTFTVEAAGSGTATTPPAWGPLMLACGFTQTVQTASVDYTPTSTFGTNSSVTIYYYLDGHLHKVTGARGTFALNLQTGERPVFRFRFLGKYVAPTATANATPTLTAFQTPRVVNNTNSEQIRIGAVTYTAATGVVSAGTQYPWRGVSIDVGNALNHQTLVGSETVEITQREVTGRMTLDLTASQVVSFMSDVVANTSTGIGITHGNTAGNIIVVHAPVVQRINPSVEDYNGQALHAFDLRLLPSSGNDELRIVSR
jgi:hypothetical protein